MKLKSILKQDFLVNAIHAHFKLSKNDKTVNVSRDDTGEITLDWQDHSISLSFNRITTPPSNEEQKQYQMISDVMGTPRNKAMSSVNIDDMD